MNTPWEVIGKLAAKAVVWIAPRLGKSPRDLITEAAREGVEELQRKQGRKPPTMRFPPG